MAAQKTEALMRLEEIITTVSGVSIEEVHSRSREKNVCDARHAIWLIARTEFLYSYKYLSRVYGKDRTTIMHGIARIKNTKHSQTILDGIKKIDPTITTRARAQKTLGIESWVFEQPGYNVGIAPVD